MPDNNRKETAAETQRVRLTVQLTEPAYGAINEIQRRHRVERGRALPIWKVVDEAVRDYAKKKGIRLKE
jgi:UDP-N-acetylmuramyl pentapeptide synthase